MFNSSRVAMIVLAAALMTSGAMVLADQGDVRQPGQGLSENAEDLACASDLARADWTGVAYAPGASAASAAADSPASCSAYWCVRCNACVPTAQICRTMACPEL